MDQYTDSKSAQIGITTMFGVLVITDLVGNTLVCLVIVLYHEMRYAGYLSQLRSNNPCQSYFTVRGLFSEREAMSFFTTSTLGGGGGGEGVPRRFVNPNPI